MIKLSIALTKKVIGCTVMFMVLKYYFVETLKSFENKNSYFSKYTFKMFIELKIKCVGAIPMKGY